MANTFKALFRGAATTGGETLYTVPALTTTLITTVVVVNTAGAPATFDMSLATVQLANDVTVPANDSIVLEIKQVISAGETITALASATTVNFHVSGLEIS